ncbi:MAG: hypothetical protein HPY75_14545 [Actinobacteria bacterium]|nr:hypothetical protein [Actinomycetota bacterium]
MGWDSEFCVLEIVATGPDPDTALPVEAAALRVRSGRECDAFFALIDPGARVPAFLLEYNGRGDEEYEGGASPGEALERLRDFLGERTVVAHAFRDMEGPLLARFDAVPAGKCLDVLDVAWLAVPYLRDHSLASLASSLIGEAPSWRALEDARLLLRVLHHLRNAWEEMPRLARGAILAALEEAGSPWRDFLPGSPGRSRFPDLTEALVKGPEAASRSRPAGMETNEAVPSERRRGTRESPLQNTKPRSPREPCAEGDAASLLSEGGPLAAQRPDHEIRPQQADMAAAVEGALTDGAFLVVEAGTGVGKSLAYLLPGILHARRGGGPLVVSTYTRNLQEQLFHRDLPLLSRALGALDFALLKGRGNYLCLRKWAEWCASLSRGEAVLRLGDLAPALSYAYIASWLVRTSSGDLEEISLGLRRRLGELARELASAPEDCLRPRCRLADRCWVERARTLAASSEVVVVNHALLLTQAGNPNPVLPDFRALVVDEAHHLEDVATEALSLTFSLEDLAGMLEDLSGSRGVFSRWSGLAWDSRGKKRLAEAYDAAEKAGAQAEELCLGALEGFFPAGEREERMRLDEDTARQPAWEKPREKGLSLSATLRRLSRLTAEMVEGVPALEDREDEEAARFLRRGEVLSERLNEAAEALEVFMRDPDQGDFRLHLRWMERPRPRSRRAPPSFRLRSAPVDVGPELYSLLFARLEACVLTSASLRVPGPRDGFSFFLRRTGLELLEEGGEELRLLALDSPFDYARQVRLFAVTDLPEPAAGGSAYRDYMRSVGEVVEEVVTASGGKALVLLTSHRQVEELHKELRPRLEERGLCCLRQDREMPNALLLERFREDRDSVLLATEAFWEGVDVPGESLSAVVMVKLPFRHPGEPVVAGRVEHYDRAGLGGWNSYYVPLAVTLFRQGVGRLIRRSTDRGVIVVLDPRFLTRSYARLFRQALPRGLEVERVDRARLGQLVEEYFANQA